jgi:hypothetical protein
MMLRLCLLISLFTLGLAFSPIKPVVTAVLKQQAKLYAGSSSMMIDSESDARYYMAKAQECPFLFSDTYSIKEAKEYLKEYLNEIIEMQSGCVTGTLVGHDLCDDQDVAAAHLCRQKITNQQSKLENTR